MDIYLKSTESTLNALNKLYEEYLKNTNMPLEEFQKLRDKHIDVAKSKWIKYIYSVDGMTNKNDSRYSFLNIDQPPVIQVIVERLKKTLRSYSLCKQERMKKWRKICKANFDKSLDNRSHIFKLNDKKELLQKHLMKECKDKHNNQVDGKLSSEEILKVFTTFKPCDYPFETPIFDDEPITLRNPILHKHLDKLPTYRMQMADDSSFELCWKILISVVGFQSYSEKGLCYIDELLRHFFKIDCLNMDRISCVEYSESDRDILIGILAPQIY